MLFNYNSNNGKDFKFSDVFKEYREFNSNNIDQYTVGKYGIKKMEQSDLYSKDKHIVFHPNCLVLGIGIEECGVSLNINGSCSPIYKVYKINNDIITTEYCYYFIKLYLNKYRRFITQKSTRREFEIQYNELKNISFELPSRVIQKEYSQLLCSLNNKVENESNILLKYQEQKRFLLNNLFI